MAAGNQPTQAQINASAGFLAVQLRNLFQQIDWLTQEVNVLGQAGLVGLGFQAGDAAVIVSTLGNLETLSQIYQGKSVSQTLPFSFRDNSQGLWGAEIGIPGS
jgi:hypothetical protein